MKTNEIEKLQLKKNWAGKWSLLECCYFGKEYYETLKDAYGVGLKHNLFSFEHGSSAHFLVPSEVEMLVQKLIEKVQQNESIAFELANSIAARADDVFHFVKSFKTQRINKKDFDYLWKLLHAFLLVNFPMKKIVDYLPQELLKHVLPMLEKARVHAEPVYAESLEFVKKFAIDNSHDFHLSPELFLCLTDKELDALFSNGKKPKISTLQARFAFSLLSVVEGKINVFVGSRARQLADKTIDKIFHADHIQGMCAFPGKVQGIVRIVVNPHALRSLPKNTIIVTGMTRPDYLHLFKEAVAVVTDAGGILSHAAITARELKKPTVIGTEIATKLLKDGDVVEVDAERGVVKLLKK